MLVIDHEGKIRFRDYGGDVDDLLEKLVTEAEK